MKFTEEATKIFFGIMITLLILVIGNHYLLNNDHLEPSASYDKNSDYGILIESLYFSTTTLSTVGYGDILPKTEFGKLSVAMEHLFLLCVAFGGITYSLSE
jgi:voltage-gated potassium channel Kch